MNYNIYRISRDKWNKIVNNHSRQHHNPPSGNQIYMGRKAKRRDSSVKLWRQQFEKRNASETNIYTSIQCVVSRGLTLGKLGNSQSKDCTQWGIHSHFLLKWSQNNKQFWVDSFITQIVPIYHLAYTGLSNWATSCLTKISTTTTVFKQFYFQKATSWSCKTEKGL